MSTLRRGDVEGLRVRVEELGGRVQERRLHLVQLRRDLLVPLGQLLDERVHVLELGLHGLDELLGLEVLLHELLLHSVHGLAKIDVDQVDAVLAVLHRLHVLFLVALLVGVVDDVRTVDDDGHLVVYLEQLVVDPVQLLGMLAHGLHHIFPGVTVEIVLAAEVPHKPAQLGDVHGAIAVLVEDRLGDSRALRLRCRCGRHLAQRGEEKAPG